MDRVLVIGANGQLGSDLLPVLASPGRAVVGVDVPDIDITDGASVAALIGDIRPDVVVNAAAYTAVDAAEENAALAMAVNGDGPAHVARACAAVGGCRLIHISTDYVFAGDKRGPYDEDDEPGPRSVYGRTKLAGEVAVLDMLPDRGFVVRTAWLYGAGGPNFVKTMLRLERDREFVDVVDDQVGQPTWARDLAGQVLRLAQSGAPAGVYHGTNAGSVSWFGFTQEIFRLAGADPRRVRPTTSEAFKRPAPRPANSVLGHSRWKSAGIPAMRPWDEALREALPQVAAAG